MLPLIEVIKIVRLRSLLSDVRCLSSPKLRLRHGRRHAHLSPKSVYPFLGFVPGSSSSSPNSPDYLFPREPGSVFADYLRSHFFSYPKPCVAEPWASCLNSDEPCAQSSLITFSAPPSPPLNFSRMLQTTLCPLPLVQTKLPIPC